MDTRRHDASAESLMPELVLPIDLSTNLCQQIRRALYPVVVRTELQREIRSISLLVRVPAHCGPDLSERLETVRRHAKVASVIGVYLDKHSDLRMVAPLRQHGLQEVITSDVLDQQELLRTTIGRAHRVAESDYIWRCSGLNISEAAATVLRAALLHAHRPMSLPTLAASLRMHERSVRKYCVQHRLPSPQWLMGWARVLTAAHYLDIGTWSIKDTAAILGFASPAQFSNLLRRYTGLTARALMQDGALQSATQCAENAINYPD